MKDRGKGRDGTEDLLVCVDEWHRTRCWVQNAVSFISSQEAHSNFPIRVSVNNLLFSE